MYPNANAASNAVPPRAARHPPERVSRIFGSEPPLIESRALEQGACRAEQVGGQTRPRRRRRERGLRRRSGSTRCQAGTRGSAERLDAQLQCLAAGLELLAIGEEGRQIQLRVCQHRGIAAFHGELVSLKHELGWRLPCPRRRNRPWRDSTGRRRAGHWGRRPRGRAPLPPSRSRSTPRGRRHRAGRSRSCEGRRSRHRRARGRGPARGRTG